MKPRKLTRKATDTRADDVRDRLAVGVESDHAGPRGNPAFANPPVRQPRKPRRAGTKQRKAPP